MTNISNNEFPGHYPGEDHSWSVDKFRNNFHVTFHSSAPYQSAFSLVGLDAAIANAFRRILLADIPTLAIEYVFVQNNTSVIQDEVLAARLGLVPFKGSKEGIKNFLKFYKKPTEEDPTPGEAYDYNTVTLNLKVECTRNEEAAKAETDPHKAYHNAHVYASQIEFVPQGRQVEYFSGDDIIQPVNPDILIAKLRPGQCIDVEMHAIKGTGADHAKFSPVATAFYRLMPSIQITEPILGKDAEKFRSCFPPGVIKIDRITREEAQQEGTAYFGREGEKKAVVEDPMKDTVSRECLRHDEFNKKVKLGRVRDHFIFSIESTGQFNSDDLFVESVRILKDKCVRLKKNLANMNR